MPLFSDASSSVDDPYLAHALRLALRGSGTAAPNPLVGCVVVKDGRIVGEGFHARAGQPHAEVLALADAGEQASGADVYVTLEPCAHHGRTPPCADALVAANVRSVTIGMNDPNPTARGGIERLRGAGIEVHVAKDPSPFAELNAGWLKRLASGVPRVIAKVGVSLDACPSLSPAARASMTGPYGREVTRRLRSRVDAVLVGASTVRVDDPELTSRDSSGVPAAHQPLRVVLARETMPPADARVFTDGRADTVLLVPDTMPDDGTSSRVHDVTVLRYDGNQGVVGALRTLGAQGVNDLLVEPGPRLLRAFLDADAIDILVVVTGGGFAGPSAPRLLQCDLAPAAWPIGTIPALHPPSCGTAEPDALVRPFIAREAEVVGDVAVTVWERSSVKTDG